MERIRLIINSMLLDVLGSVTLLSEGVMQIQAVLLEKMRDRFREFAQGVASEIATSHATTDKEKAEIKRIMRRMESPTDIQFSEAEVLKVMDELERLGLIAEVPGPTLEPSCDSCSFLQPGPDNLTYCAHGDAEGVAGITENTGYVKGVQPRKQPSWCPLLPKSEEDPPATKNSPVPLDPTKQREE